MWTLGAQKLEVFQILKREGEISQSKRLWRAAVWCYQVHLHQRISRYENHFSLVLFGTIKILLCRFIHSYLINKYLISFHKQTQKHIVRLCSIISSVYVTTLQRSACVTFRSSAYLLWCCLLRFVTHVCIELLCISLLFLLIYRCISQEKNTRNIIKIRLRIRI